MNNDPTELIRRELQALINSNPKCRECLVEAFGQAWDTEELCRDFVVEAYVAPLVIVRRKEDGKLGSLFFQHGPPRLYFFFQADEPDKRKEAA